MSPHPSVSPRADAAESLRFVPAEFAPDTLESLFAAHGGSRPWIHVCLLLGCVAAALALPLIEIDVTVRAPAVVRAAATPGSVRIDAFVPQREIGRIIPGQRARIDVDAFPLREWGALEGTVAGIADEAEATPGGSTFRVVVETAPGSPLFGSIARGALRSGMTATARFAVTRQSLFQLFFHGSHSPLPSPRVSEVAPKHLP
jgi:hypothetical protein